jgi:hypothetical protein
MAVLQEQRQLLEAQLELKRVQHAEKLLESMWYWDDFGGSDLFDRVRPQSQDEGGERWVPPSVPSDRRHGADWPLWRTQAELDEYRQQARIRCASNSYAKGLLKNRVNNVIGKGFSYEAAAIVPKGAEPAEPNPQQLQLEKDAQAVIDRFLKVNNWNGTVNPNGVLAVTATKERQTFKRVERDGEAFLRFFRGHGDDGKTTVLMRYIEPEQIRDTGGTLWTEGWSWGIQHQMDPFEDVETPVAYRVVYQDPTAKGSGEPKEPWEDIPADEVLHVKGPETDSTVARGLSAFIWDTGRALDRAAKLQRNLSMAAAVRAATAEIWQQRQALSGQAAGLAAGLAEYTTTTRNGQQLNIQRAYPGQVRRIDSGQELVDLPTDQSQSYLTAKMGDLQQAGSASCSPAFWLGDTENANYSNLESASAPAVREGQNEQEYYKTVNCLCVWKALLWAAEQGELPQNIAELITVEVEAPSVLHRNELEKAQEDQISVQGGWKDRQTCAEERGLDWAKVQQRNDEWADQQAERQQQMQAMAMPGEDAGAPKPAGGDQQDQSASGALGAAQPDRLGSDDWKSLLQESRLLEVDMQPPHQNFTGTITDSLGRKVHFENGKRVGGSDAKVKPATQRQMTTKGGTARSGATLTARKASTDAVKAVKQFNDNGDAEGLHKAADALSSKASHDFHTMTRRATVTFKRDVEAALGKGAASEQDWTIFNNDIAGPVNQYHAAAGELADVLKEHSDHGNTRQTAGDIDAVTRKMKQAADKLSDTFNKAQIALVQRVQKKKAAPAMESKDASGHEHAADGRFGTTSGSHKDKLKAAHAAHQKAKDEYHAARQEAWARESEGANKALAGAEQQVTEMYDAMSGIAWDSDSEDHADVTELESRISDLHHNEQSPADQFSEAKDIEELAKAAKELDFSASEEGAALREKHKKETADWEAGADKEFAAATPDNKHLIKKKLLDERAALRAKHAQELEAIGGDYGFEPQHAAENMVAFDKIIAGCKAMRKALKQYSGHRKEMKAIKSGEMTEGVKAAATRLGLPLLENFTGTDAHGHHWVNGKQVKAPDSPSSDGGTSGKAEPAPRAIQAFMQTAKKAFAKAGAAGKALKAKTQEKYKAMEARYGRKTALAIFASGQAFGWGLMGVGQLTAGVPLYIPGSTYLGMLPAIAIAELHYRIKHRLAEGAEAELSQHEIDELGQQLYQEIADHWEELGGGKDAE